jgi:hypothetical protein
MRVAKAAEAAPDAVAFGAGWRAGMAVFSSRAHDL